MKRQTRTKTAMKLSAMIVSAFMMLAACTETVQKQKIPGATYMEGNNTPDFPVPSATGFLV